MPHKELELVCEEVVASLRSDTNETFDFYTLFAKVAHSHGIFHGTDRQRYNSYFRQAKKACKKALGDLRMKRALIKKEQRPAFSISPERAYAINQRMSGERDD
ncbi:MAG: hypothetical protein AAB519_02785 [Patescibacteria group bacterium]